MQVCTPVAWLALSTGVQGGRGGGGGARNYFMFKVLLLCFILAAHLPLFFQSH